MGDGSGYGRVTGSGPADGLWKDDRSGYGWVMGHGPADSFRMGDMLGTARRRLPGRAMGPGRAGQ